MSFSNLKGEFIGRSVLSRQFEEMKQRENRLPFHPGEAIGSQKGHAHHHPGPGIARQGYEVYAKGEPAGRVTSGTMVPYWFFPETGILSGPTDERKMRTIAMVYVDSDLEEDDRVEIRTRARPSRGSSLSGIFPERLLPMQGPFISRRSRPDRPRSEV